MASLIKANQMIGALPGNFSAELKAIIASLNEELKIKDRAKKLKVYSKEEPLEPALEHDSIYIHNAGLVLLSPYLDRLFHELGFLPKKDGAIGVAQTGKALQLMHYLVTGSKKVLEKDLPLNKLLYGLETTTFVPVNHILADNETALAEILLQSVIKNWSILGNTSIQGLRETFLIRDGKITNKDKAYYLTVEKKQFDMLIKHLPWSISPIKHSRMIKPLYVTWI